MLSEAIILAGGFGTRLQSVVSDVPKPMAPVNQLPFLDYMFRYLKHYDIKSVVLSVGYLADKIKERYQTSYNGLTIRYAVENTPLGTGGGIRLAMEKCETNQVLVLNGDSFFDVNIQHLYALHNANRADCTLALRRVEDAARYGTIKINQEGRIYQFREKDGKAEAGIINGGVYVLNRQLYLDKTVPNQSFSIEKDFFEAKINELKIVGLELNTYFIDIGIPEDYKKAQDDFKGFTY